MIHFDESFLTLHWDEGTRIVWAQWKEPVEGEPLIRGLRAGLDLIIQKKAPKWLADTKVLGASRPEDLKWINETWMSTALGAGLRWMAFVMPKKVVAQLSVKAVVSRVYDKDLGTSYFDNVDDARAWLKAQR